MTIDIEQLRADMEAGTDGPWNVRNLKNFGTDIASGNKFDPVRVARVPQENDHPDARRIARLPDLEQDYLDLHKQHNGLAVINMQVTAERDALKEQNRKLREALAKIEKWGLPETGKFWPSGEPVSYEVENGSHGARDYIRGTARAALAEGGEG